MDSPLRVRPRMYVYMYVRWYCGRGRVRVMLLWVRVVGIAVDGSVTMNLLASCSFAGPRVAPLILGLLRAHVSARYLLLDRRCGVHTRLCGVYELPGQV